MEIEPERHRPLLEPILDDEELDTLLTDRSLLKPYLSSDKFFQRFRKADEIIYSDLELFFHTLLVQWLSMESDKELFDRKLMRQIKDETNKPWRTSSLRQYLNDHALVDHLTDALRRFGDADNAFKLPVRESRDYRYFSDILQVVQDLDSESERFGAYLYGAHYALFMTGVRPERVRKKYRTDQGLLDLSDYDRFGRSFFERAAKHDQAEQRQLQGILQKISDGFTTIRTALHNLLSRFRSP